MPQKWIVVADSPFLPAHSGGQRENLGFVRAAARAGRMATLVIPTGTPLDLAAYAEVVGDVPIVTTARKTGPWRLAHPKYPFVVASRPYPAGLSDRVAVLAAGATGVVTYSYKSRWIGQRLAENLHLPMIVRQHNREGDYHRSLAAGSSGVRKSVLQWEAWRIARDEKRFDRSAAVTAVADISADDAAARRRAGARHVVHVPPFAFDVDAMARPPRRVDRTDGSAGLRVLFVGSLDVVTNLTGLSWFLDGAWPVVRRASPSAILDVVGSNPDRILVEKLAAIEGVELHADVPSLAPYLERAAVAINPAVSGSGVNIKVIDYLLAGLPIVSTDLVTRGLPLRAGADLEVRTDAAAFGSAVADLLADPVRAGVMAGTGRRHALEILDPARNLDRIADAFTAGRPD